MFENVYKINYVMRITKFKYYGTLIITILFF